MGEIIPDTTRKGLTRKSARLLLVECSPVWRLYDFLDTVRRELSITRGDRVYTDTWKAVKELDHMATPEKQAAFYGAFTSKDSQMVRSRKAILNYARKHLKEKRWETTETNSDWNRRALAKAVIKDMRAAGIPLMPVRSSRGGEYFDAAANHPTDWVEYVIRVGKPKIYERIDNPDRSYAVRREGPQFTNTPIWQFPIIPMMSLWRWWARFPPKSQMKYILIAIGFIWLNLILFAGDYGL